MFRAIAIGSTTGRVDRATATMRSVRVAGLKENVASLPDASAVKAIKVVSYSLQEAIRLK